MSRVIAAAVCVAHGAPLEIEPLHLADPGPGEVRVTIKACAICHSDLLYINGGWDGPLPAVYGHEASGIVEAVGAGVTHISPGDRAIVTLVRSCGSCRCCSSGLSVACETRFPLDARSPLTRPDGAPVIHGLRTGAFAEAVVVEQSQVVTIPKDIGFDVAALLACGVVTGVGAVTNTAQLKPGDHAVVIGLGGVGINAVQGARLAGAQTIVGVDLSDDKLEAGRRFGATHSVRADSPDAAAQIRAATDGRGADYVFVCAGVKPAYDSALAMLAPGGALVAVGMPPSGVISQYEPGDLAAAAQRILGSKMGDTTIQTDIPQLIDLYRQGKLELDALISGRFPLGEINAALDASRGGSALRNVIIM